MSAIRKVTGGAAAVVALSLGGAGLHAMNASAQDAGAEEAVNPSVATTVTTTASTVAPLGSAAAVTTVAPAATTVSAASTSTTAAVAAGAGAPTTVKAAAGAAEIAAELPITGSDVGTPVKVGAGLGALGLGALLIARRRRPAAPAV